MNFRVIYTKSSDGDNGLKLQKDNRGKRKCFNKKHGNWSFNLRRYRAAQILALSTAIFKFSM